MRAHIARLSFLRQKICVFFFDVISCIRSDSINALVFTSQNTFIRVHVIRVFPLKVSVYQRLYHIKTFFFFFFGQIRNTIFFLPILQLDIPDKRIYSRV